MHDPVETLVERDTGAEREDQDRHHERPEVDLLAVAEGMSGIRRGLGLLDPEEQKPLVTSVHQRVDAFGHHRGRSGDAGGHKFRNRNQGIADEGGVDNRLVAGCHAIRVPLGVRRVRLGDLSVEDPWDFGWRHHVGHIRSDERWRIRITGRSQQGRPLDRLPEEGGAQHHVARGEGKQDRELSFGIQSRPAEEKCDEGNHLDGVQSDQVRHAEITDLRVPMDHRKSRSAVGAADGVASVGDDVAALRAAQQQDEQTDANGPDPRPWRVARAKHEEQREDHQHQRIQEDQDPHQAEDAAVQRRVKIEVRPRPADRLPEDQGVFEEDQRRDDPAEPGGRRAAHPQEGQEPRDRPQVQAGRETELQRLHPAIDAEHGRVVDLHQQQEHGGGHHVYQSDQREPAMPREDFKQWAWQFHSPR